MQSLTDLDATPPPAHRADTTCPQCGGVVVFDADAAGLRCGHCGVVEAIAPRADTTGEIDYAATLAQLTADAPCSETQVASCGTCGAELSIPPDVAATHCPFCSSPIVDRGHSARGIAPNAILPFAVGRAAAREAYRGWLDGRWFAPAGLRQDVVADALQGVYVPYWLFSCDASAFYTGRRGDVVQEGDSHRLQWRHVAGRIEDVMTYTACSGTTSLDHTELAALAPWDWARLEPYAPTFLRGFRAERYHVDLPTAFEQAQTDFRARLDSGVRAHIGGDRQEITSCKPTFSRVAFRHVLVPVWISAYRYRGTVYRFMVNGRTGRVQGQHPLELWKVTTAAAAGLAAACGLGMLVMWLLKALAAAQ